MKKTVFTLLLFIGTFVILPAQEKCTEKAGSKKEVINNKKKKEKSKTVEKDNVCLLTREDELKSFAGGKITHPTSVPRIKREIAELTSCSVENIRIISGGDAGNTAEYIACVCGTKMVYKADYQVNIRTVKEL